MAEQSRNRIRSIATQLSLACDPQIGTMPGATGLLVLRDQRRGCRDSSAALPVRLLE
jgi:hypothetical protein